MSAMGIIIANACDGYMGELTNKRTMTSLPLRRPVSSDRLHPFQHDDFRHPPYRHHFGTISSP